MKTLVMTGGGTGGHIIPNLALIPDLKKDFKIFYLGENNSLEQELISKDKDVTFVAIPAVKFIRKLTLKNLLIPFRMIRNIKFTKKVLEKIKPDVIFAKGGYVSLPVVYAGSKLKIPIYSHESDYTMGLANKLILRKAKIMFTSFRNTCISNKCVYSGSPIRQKIFTGKREIAEKRCNFTHKQPAIMFFGGSLGSKNINQFVFNNINLLDEFNIIHFVGKGNSTPLNRANYCQIEFAENIYDYFALAEIVICRAGSNSIFELLALRKLMILIPLSREQSRGDQIENAKVFKKEGFAQVIEEKDLNIENLLRKVDNGLKNRFYYISNMKKTVPNTANKTICNYLKQV